MTRLLKIDPRPYLLLALSLLLCFFASELIFRWWSYGKDAWSYTQMKSVRHIGTSGLLQASSYQDILWELRPNLDTRYKLFAFRTNSAGLRDIEYSRVKPRGTVRVAVIGDSFTMAEGVAIEDAYHSVLEQRLNALGDGRRYELINFGVAGYSLVQYSAVIRRRALDYDPDLILIGFCAANDSKLPNLEAFNRPYRVKPETNGFVHSYFLEHLGDIYKDGYKKIRGRRSGENADPDYVNREFAEMRRLVSTRGIPIVIAYIDNKTASLDRELVERAARANGFGYIDATKNFPESVIPAYAVSLTDAHPNAAANAVLADNIFPALRETLSAPSGALLSVSAPLSH